MTAWRPLCQSGAARPPDAIAIAGGWTWAAHAERLERGRPPQIVPVADLPADVLARLTSPRPPVAGLSLDRARIMAIVNATPDSFSDGGLHATSETAIAHARQMRAEGADILDIGGESTRPGAAEVPASEETARVLPIVAALADHAPLSIDTRKAGVAAAAMAAGAVLVNDVSAMTHDPDMPALLAATDVPVCLMHAQGDPETMQRAPAYDDVLLDVHDWLEERIGAAERAGIARSRLIVDPGIGFGKTLAHNLALIRGLSVFHDLGCPILFGASRKRFLGTLTDVAQPRDRVHGSVAVALAAVSQGVQILRVHDTGPTRQALTVWQAATGTGPGGSAGPDGAPARP